MEVVALVHGAGGGPVPFRDILAGLGAIVTEVRLFPTQRRALPCYNRKQPPLLEMVLRSK